MIKIKNTAMGGTAAFASGKKQAFPCILIALSAFLATAAAAVPLEVYGSLPHLENVALSPDGSRIAFVKTAQDTRIVAISALSDYKLIGGVRIGNQKLREIQWADNDHLMLVTSTTTFVQGLLGPRGEWFTMQVYDLRKKKLTLVPNPNSVRGTVLMNVIAGRVMVRRLDGHTVLFVPGIYVTDLTRLALIRIDLETGLHKVVREGGTETEGWVVNEAGEVVAEENYYEREQRWGIKIRQNGRLQEIAAGHEPIDSPDLLGLGPKGDSIIVAAIEQGQRVWRLLSLTDGKFSAPMAEGKGLDAPIEHPQTHHMIGGMYIDDDAHYVFFESTLQKRWDSITRAFAPEHIRLESVTDDFMKYIVKVNGMRSGFQYRLVDMNTHRADPVGDVYDGLTEAHEVRRITYQAADGLEIPAYLTLPSGPAPRGLPLIVLPHGGPAVRDTADFDWWGQALADQGYAVLQPNYRGSDLNWRFLSAGFGEFGRKMQTDLSDGVRYLVKEGIADPARVCIVGGSYGGYAALAGVALDAKVYRCAVSVAGLSDLKRMLRWVQEKHRYGNGVANRYWDRFMGVKGPNDPALDAISPIKHIDAINVPVLLIHGRDDTVVPFEQSAVMLEALQRAHKPVELVALKKEDHWLSRGETRLQMLQSSIAFLRTHNPPDPPTFSAVKNP